MKVQELKIKVEDSLLELASLTETAKNSREVLDYLSFLGKFHQYSFYNTLSIFFHCPEATYVAGFVAWKKLGRWVRKGEKGIPILAPCFKKVDVENADGEEEEKEITFYKIVYVFDVSQTDGEELPEAPITANCGDLGLLPVLEQVVAKHSIQLSYKTLAGSHHGTSFGGKIEIDDRLESGGKATVIIHELAHELLHQKERKVTTKQAETEAEAVSYVVASYFGLETASANYLALWEVPEEEIIGSFQHIHKVAVNIIQDVQKLMERSN